MQHVRRFPDATLGLTCFCSKRRNAQLAQEQSAHLFLCLLISDLTQRYGPVIRQAKVVGVLDAAFDVLVPEFGIEKRVHVDQMPIDVSTFNSTFLAIITVLPMTESCVRGAFAYSTAILVGPRCY